jgi:putative ABC transport system substrate-binding protein
MKRRQFITLLGGAATTWPLPLIAQQRAMPEIGFLGARTPQADVQLVAALRRGLNDTGYVEGRNVAIEFRWADGRYDQMSALAADLVRRQVATIIAVALPAALAAKDATATIPILFTIADDPVEFRLVASLNRPGGNATGVSTISSALAAKQLEMLRDLVPQTATIGLLVNRSNPTSGTFIRVVQEAASALRLNIHVVTASREDDFEAAFASLDQQHAGALLVSTESVFLNLRHALIATAARHRTPAIYDRREYVEAGGLMSYGTSLADVYRLIGTYAGRILKGEKPADLPVQQPTKYELVINLRTAKALGLDVPATVLARADEVIE